MTMMKLCCDLESQIGLTELLLAVKLELHGRPLQALSGTYPIMT